MGFWQGQTGEDFTPGHSQPVEGLGKQVQDPSPVHLGLLGKAFPNRPVDPAELLDTSELEGEGTLRRLPSNRCDLIVEGRPASSDPVGIDQRPVLQVGVAVVAGDGEDQTADDLVDCLLGRLITAHRRKSFSNRGSHPLCVKGPDGHGSRKVSADKGEKSKVIAELKARGFYEEIAKRPLRSQIREEIRQPLTPAASIDPLQVILEFLPQHRPWNRLSVAFKKPKLGSAIRCFRKISDREFVEEDLQPPAQASTPASAKRKSSDGRSV